MKIIVTSLRAAKPGYGCLGKRRGSVARIMKKPEKLNEKIERVEAEEKKHLIIKRSGDRQKFVHEDVPLQYKYTSPYQIFPESF
jgi:hypothetical protein